MTANNTENNIQPPAQVNVQLNMNHIRGMNIFIAIPAYGGQTTDALTLSLIKWANYTATNGINWTIQTLANESLITRARNTLTAYFLSQPQFTHLMFIDADIGFEPIQLLMLLDQTKDPKVKLVGGLYPLKKLPLQWNVNGLQGAQIQQNGLLEVEKTATGFMLIDRDVFKTVDQHQRVVPYKNDLGLQASLDPFMKSYWDAPIVNSRLLSEDFNFCEMYRDLGGQVFVDTRIQLTHSGYYTFSSENQHNLFNEIKSRNLIK